MSAFERVPAEISDRQWDLVLKLYKNGYGGTEIARTLGVSRHTVANRLRGIQRGGKTCQKPIEAYRQEFYNLWEE